ncbi:regulator of sigma E protease [Ereboglobus sp. PH5-10]|uniref:RIP metalloprotease RseP n=1 Tax=Ereboglobus sp. PH5-10 TaxID=2940629 RepID=UPI002406FB79|nr:RIP metalloprotease RseP [Ereboglobus sp. PH5-10]MDF9828482.1 regulator of sigma E protease [Ereboglobus sp. PH5-10]
MDHLQTIFSNVWYIALAIFFLGVSIFVHELGHFLAARKRGMKVERFSIGFGPKIVSWTGKDGVEYRLSWLPLGGYVALPQLADMGAIEGESKTAAEKLPPISFSTKVIVASAGAVFNVIFAFLLATIVWAVGQQVAEQPNVIGVVRPVIETSDGKIITSPAAAAGIKAGDTVLAVDGREVSTFSDIFESIMLGSGRGENDAPKVTLTIRRDGAVRDIDVFPAYVSRDNLRSIGISIATKVVAANIVPGSAAADAGLKTGDMLMTVDGREIQSTSTIIDHIAQTKDKPITLKYIRADKEHSITLTPRLSENPQTKEPAYMIGITLGAILPSRTAHITPWAQIGEVFTRTWRTLKSLGNRNSDIGLDKMSGPIGIVTIISSAARSSIIDVLYFLVLINVSLAIFNMLPIPVLDGGHILFAVIAKVRGRPLPASVIATTQSVFMLLLFSMIIYVSFFDVRRNLPQSKPAPAAQQQAPEKPAAEEPSK